MTTANIREKLVQYLQQADDKKIKAIYTLVEDEIESAVNEIDDAFYQELQRRTREFENGTGKVYTLEESKKRVEARLKAKRK